MQIPPVTPRATRAYASAAATRTGARVLRRPDLGTLQPGQAGNLVVLGRDPLADVANVRSVERVVRGGRLWTCAELAYPAPAEH